MLKCAALVYEHLSCALDSCVVLINMDQFKGSVLKALLKDTILEISILPFTVVIPVVKIIECVIV